jgi:hypothetical protein
MTGPAMDDDCFSMDDNCISSRDVDDRILHLAALRDDAREGAARGEEEHAGSLPGIEAELAAWEQMKAALGNDGRWANGITLIQDHYWNKYANEVAHDLLGDAMDEWPCTLINWTDARRALRQYYQEVIVSDAQGEGHLFWARA